MSFSGCCFICGKYSVGHNKNIVLRQIEYAISYAFKNPVKSNINLFSQEKVYKANALDYYLLS